MSTHKKALYKRSPPIAVHSWSHKDHMTIYNPQDIIKLSQWPANGARWKHPSTQSACLPVERH